MSIRDVQPINLTPRERAELDWEKEATKLQAEAHQLQVETELQIRKLEVKWTQLFRIPQSIILLPVKLIMSLAIPISVITKKDLPDAYWEFLRG